MLQTIWPAAWQSRQHRSFPIHTGLKHRHQPFGQRRHANQAPHGIPHNQLRQQTLPASDIIATHQRRHMAGLAASAPAVTARPHQRRKHSSVQLRLMVIGYSPRNRASNRGAGLGAAPITLRAKARPLPKANTFRPKANTFRRAGDPATRQIWHRKRPVMPARPATASAVRWQRPRRRHQSDMAQPKEQPRQSPAECTGVKR